MIKRRRTTTAEDKTVTQQQKQGIKMETFLQRYTFTDTEANRQAGSATQDKHKH